jgi:hypothetical protein
MGMVFLIENTNFSEEIEIDGERWFHDSGYCT